MYSHTPMYRGSSYRNGIDNTALPSKHAKEFVIHQMWGYRVLVVSVQDLCPDPIG